MNGQILAMVISLCNIQSLEDVRGKWTKLQAVERYQKECRIWYIDCLKKGKNSGLHGDSIEGLVQCIKERDV